MEREKKKEKPPWNSDKVEIQTVLIVGGCKISGFVHRGCRTSAIVGGYKMDFFLQNSRRKSGLGPKFREAKRIFLSFICASLGRVAWASPGQV